MSDFALAKCTVHAPRTLRRQTLSESVWRRAEASSLARTKSVHIVLIVLYVLIGVWLGLQGRGWTEAVLMPSLAFLLGGAVELFEPGASKGETTKRTGELLETWLAGVFHLLGAVPFWLE